jgi:hypothetical protein
VLFPTPKSIPRSAVYLAVITAYGLNWSTVSFAVQRINELPISNGTLCGLRKFVIADASRYIKHKTVLPFPLAAAWQLRFA